jgi:hypothetical protein
MTPCLRCRFIIFQPFWTDVSTSLDRQ